MPSAASVEKSGRTQADAGVDLSKQADQIDTTGLGFSPLLQQKADLYEQAALKFWSAARNYETAAQLRLKAGRKEDAESDYESAGFWFTRAAECWTTAVSPQAAALAYEMSGIAYRAFAEINEGDAEYCEAVSGRIKASDAFQLAAGRHAADAATKQVASKDLAKAAAKAADPRVADDDRAQAATLKQGAVSELQLSANASATAADEARAAADDLAQCT